MKPNQHLPLDVWSRRLGERLSQTGRVIDFLRGALYPVMQVNVYLLERARERMGELELTILGLIHRGVQTQASLALLTGMAGHRMGPLLREFEHRGLVCETQPGELTLSMLGNMTTESGCMTIRSCRAVLLCGVTGRLLPKAAYELPLMGQSELRSKKYLPPLFIAEASAISLKHLDLAEISNRKIVNLPDEVICIEGVDASSAKPRFIESVIVLSQSANGDQLSEIHLPSQAGAINWLTRAQVMGLVEPLGFSSRKTPDEALAEIREVLKEMGGTVGRYALDAFGNPMAYLLEASDELLATRFARDRLFFSHIGCAEKAPVPLNQFKAAKSPEKSSAELLQGRSLTIRAEPGSVLEARLSIARFLSDLDRILQRARRLGSKGEAEAAFQTAATLAQSGHEEADISALATLLCLYDLSTLMKKLQSDNATTFPV